jgi:hypothetical protein
MSTQKPLAVGSDPATAPPETFVQLLVTLEHRRGLSPREMLRTVDVAAERVDAAIERIDLSDLPLGRSDLDSFRRLHSAGVPLHPVQTGELVLTCHSDVIEAVERACNATDLREYARDVAGRAYRIQVDVMLVREEERDTLE